MIFKARKSDIIHIWTRTVNPGYKNIEKFRGGVQWYMTEGKVIVSSICFKNKK